MALIQATQQTWLADVAGAGTVVTKYPVNAAGVSLTASGSTTGAYKFAAANANVKQIVAKNTVGANYRLVWANFNTYSATSIFVIRLGSGSAAGTAIAQIVEIMMTEISNVGVSPPQWFRYSPTVTANGTTDAILGDAASSNAGADDTIVASVGVATLIGT